MSGWDEALMVCFCLNFLQTDVSVHFEVFKVRRKNLACEINNGSMVGPSIMLVMWVSLCVCSMFIRAKIFLFMRFFCVHMLLYFC